MILFHAAYDLHHFGGMPHIDIDSFSAQVLRTSSAILFLFVSGMSFSLSKRRHDRDGKKIVHTLRRFAIIAACAGVVSGVTYAIDNQTFVRFGILHCIAVGSLLLPALGRMSIPVGCAIVLLAMADLPMEPSFLGGITGLSDPDFFSVDHYPVIPWVGYMFIGAGCNAFLIRKNMMQNIVTPKSRSLWILLWPGRHSLSIYMLHQPVLILLIRLFV